jgi:DNA-binding transcriptional LysR family regulator
MAMNWDDMRVFLAVARLEILSKAARTLNMDPATVGRRILRLEQALGVTLFAKSPQGYGLTRDGARLLSHAQEAEAAMTMGVAGMSDEDDSLRGSIRLGAPDGCANFVLPLVLERLGRAHPDLQVQVVALPRVINLSNREADLVISVSAPQAGRLTVQKITDYHLSLAAMAPYLEDRPKIETAGDLQDHDIIGYIPDLIFDKELDYLEHLGLDAPRFSSNSVSVQLNMVRAELGLGVVHDFCLPQEVDLRRVLPDAFRLKRSFYLVRHVSDRKVERLTRFSEALIREMKAVVAALEASD